MCALCTWFYLMFFQFILEIVHIAQISFIWYATVPMLSSLFSLNNNVNILFLSTMIFTGLFVLLIRVLFYVGFFYGTT